MPGHERGADHELGAQRQGRREKLVDRVDRAADSPELGAHEDPFVFSAPGTHGRTSGHSAPPPRSLAIPRARPSTAPGLRTRCPESFFDIR
jgi:hypothetical protein